MLWIIALVLIILLMPILLFCVEVILGCLSYRRFNQGPSIEITHKKTLNAVVLVPAHNESQVISGTLESLIAACESNIKIVVIADNCTDDTVTQAQQYSCEVIERHNVLERGKGYALAFGLEHCKKYNPDVVAIIDADCTVSHSTLKNLINKTHNQQTIVQGAYRLKAPKNANAKTKISAFAVFIKNIIRPLGIAKLGGSVPITGSGFAIPKNLLDQVCLASGEIVEDMKLGLDFALAGKKVKFEPDAKISSLLPTEHKTTQIQRARWEHGHIGMIKLYAPKLFMQSLNGRSWLAFITAMDLCVLPFIVLLILSSCILLALILLAIINSMPLLLFFIVALSTLIVASLIWANHLIGRQKLTFKDLYGMCDYALSKVVLYKSLFLGERSGWAKTKRECSSANTQKTNNKKIK